MLNKIIDFVMNEVIGNLNLTTKRVGRRKPEFYTPSLDTGVNREIAKAKYNIISGVDVVAQLEMYFTKIDGILIGEEYTLITTKPNTKHFSISTLDGALIVDNKDKLKELNKKLINDLSL